MKCSDEKFSSLITTGILVSLNWELRFFFIKRHSLALKVSVYLCDILIHAYKHTLTQKLNPDS